MAKKKKPSYEELEAEVKYLRRGNKSDALSQTVQVLFKWLGIAIIAICMRDSVVALAGKTTGANILVNLLGHVTISEGVFAALGIGGTAYGIAQKRLRQNTVERVQPENQRREEEIDPTRSSSSLTPRGETNPLDRT